MENMLPSQPEKYFELIKRSMRLYFASFTKIVLFAALLSLIVFTPRLTTLFLGYNIFPPAGTINWNTLWLILIDLVSMLLFIAIVWHMHCVIINKHEPMMEDISVGIKKTVMVFVAVAIQSIIYVTTVLMVIGLQLLIAQYKDWFLSTTYSVFLLWLIVTAEFLLIVYVATLFIFLVPIIAIENKGILAALKRSVQLVWNHWLRTISVQITPWITYVTLLMIIRYWVGLDISIYFVAESSGLLWTILLQLCLFTLFIPWVAALLIVQLKDLELRNKMVLNNE